MMLRRPTQTPNTAFLLFCTECPSSMHNTVCKVEETSQENQRGFLLESAMTCAWLRNQHVPHGGSSDAPHDEDAA